MPNIIDAILSDIDKKIERYGDWHVEIVCKARTDKGQGQDKYLWNAESHDAAKAIKEYLVARGMNDGTLVEPAGPFIYVVNLKTKKE